jgi:hypothetical protein
LFPANDGAGAVHDAIAATPSGAGWLSGVLSFAAKATAGHGTTIAIAMAIFSTAIGVSALRNWHPRVFLALAIALSLVFWVVGQGLGGVFTGQATDVSTAPLMILIASLLFARGPFTELRPATTPTINTIHEHASTPPATVDTYEIRFADKNGFDQ